MRGCTLALRLAAGKRELRSVPRLSTLEEYARALGYKLKVGFELRAR